MMTRSASLLTALFTTVAIAAPVPPPSEEELIVKHFGTRTGEGEFDLDGEQLTLRCTSGKPNRTHRWDDKSTIPRTCRSCRGDFELTVRILDSTPPNQTSKSDIGQAETSAGLYIQGGETSLRLSLHQYYQNVRINGQPAAQKLSRWLRIEANYPRGSASGSLKAAEDGTSTYLRIIRKEKAITMSCSFDGKTWSPPNNPFRNIEMNMPDEITVGVFLSHSTYQFAHATFDHFTIEKPKDEKSK